MKSLAVYKFDDKLLVVVNCRFSDGISRHTLEITVVYDETPNKELVNVLSKSINSYKEGLEYIPSNSKLFSEKISKLAGAKSYSKFVKRALKIGIYQDENKIRISGSVPSKKFKGLEPFESKMETNKVQSISSSGLIENIKSLFAEMNDYIEN